MIICITEWKKRYEILHELSLYIQNYYRYGHYFILRNRKWKISILMHKWHKKNYIPFWFMFLVLSFYVLIYTIVPSNYMFFLSTIMWLTHDIDMMSLVKYIWTTYFFVTCCNHYFVELKQSWSKLEDED